MQKNVMKTYGGRVKRVLEHHNEEPVLKRRCGESGQTSLRSEDAQPDPTIISSSSPPRANYTVLSSDPPDTGIDTPPSSPPPPQLTPPTKRVLPPAFQLLSRKKHAPITSDSGRASHVLGEITNVSPERPKGKTRPSLRLTQLQIDLGTEMRKTCDACGMDYIPSNAEDAALHKAFHARYTIGLGPRKIRAGFKIGARVWVSYPPHQSTRSGVVNSVVMVHRKSLAAERWNAKAVLSVANADLSAVQIEDNILWSQIPIPALPKVEGQRTEDQLTSLKHEAHKGGMVDRFRVYVYMQGSRSVGVCLAERIFEAYKVLDEPPPTRIESESVAPSSSVSVGDVSCPAILGISRVWTCRGNRRQGIATRLLECACDTFVYGMKIPKDAVAFSQPSESGKLFAESWFKGSNGWKVYKESH